MYDVLSVEENDHGLEIGFGPGALIKKIAEVLDHGVIEGVDFSESMVAAAQKKNRKQINKGKVSIPLGDFDEVPFDDNCFDKVFSVNNIYFWENPDITIQRICRILKPGGRVVIEFHDKTDMEEMALDKDFFHYYSTHDVTELLKLNGSLNNIETISKKEERPRAIALLVEKEGTDNEYFQSHNSEGSGLESCGIWWDS